mgnify:CR=1 FL=1|tara:strand:+ start:233 stop:619 length:387 start_codon:yes stop_codon:yes gene_type:complete
MISLPVKRGEFVALAAASGFNVAPNTMNIILTPPQGQRVRLTHLSTSGANEQSDAAIKFGVTTLINGTIFGSTPTAGRYSVGSMQPYAAGLPPSGNHKNVTGKTDETLTLSSSVPLTTTVFYAYEFGE